MENPDAGSLAKAIELATERDVDVISISLAGSADIGAKEAAIQQALDKDIVIVVGAGNKPDDQGLRGLNTIPGILVATSVGRDGNHSDFAVEAMDWKEFLLLSAPGADVPEVRAGGGYGHTTGGTSISTAVLAGAAALIRAKHPDMPAYEVIHRLIATATDRGDPGYDKLYGHGVLNLTAALNDTIPPTTSPTPWSTTTHTTAQPPTTTTADDDPDTPNRKTALLITFTGTAIMIAAGLAIGLTWLLRHRR